MNLKELKQKRTDLFHQISGLRDTFTKNGDKWPTDADKQKWEQVNAEFDKVGEALDVQQRADKIDRRMTTPINPRNIGLDDAVPGQKRRKAGQAASEPREFVVDQRGNRQMLLKRGDSFAAELARANPELREQCKGVDLGGYLRAIALGPATSGK